MSLLRAHSQHLDSITPAFQKQLLFLQWGFLQLDRERKGQVIIPLESIPGVSTENLTKIEKGGGAPRPFCERILAYLEKY